MVAMLIGNNGWYSKDYGRDVKEVFYIEVCESPIFTKNPAGDVLYYDKFKRRVELGLYLDFAIVSNLNGPQFCRYLANKYLERSLDIDELKEVKDFNLKEYIKDLEAFFVLNSVL
ncbi:MAG TPA: hypothetical protein VG052_08650 [Puia sp.]|nr:hypothetical protein [Puia sp.]